MLLTVWFEASPGFQDGQRGLPAKNLLLSGFGLGGVLFLTTDVIIPIKKDLNEAREWVETIPDVVFKRAEEMLDEIARSKPEALERVEYLRSWAAGALHGAMMEEAPANRMTINELAQKFDLPEQPVGARSRTLRRDHTPYKGPDPAEVFDMDPEQMDITSSHDLDQIIPALMEAIAPAASSSSQEINLSVLDPILGDLNPQVGLEDRFDFSQFYENLSFLPEQQQTFEEAAIRGVEQYLEFVYEEGTPVEGRWGLEERLTNPDPFGYVFREFLQTDASTDLKDRVARYTLALIRAAYRRANLPHPFGALLPVNWLTGRKKLSEKPLEVAVRLALKDRHALSGIYPDEIPNVWRAITTDNELGKETKIELLLLLFDRSGGTPNPHFGPGLLKYMEQSEVSSSKLFEGLLQKLSMPEPGMKVLLPPPAVRKDALSLLAERTDEIASLAEEVFEYGRERNQDALLEAVANILRSRKSQLDTSRVEKIIQLGIKLSHAGPRKAYFELAHEWGMAEIVDQARDDRAESIREWARQGLEGSR